MFYVREKESKRLLGKFRTLWDAYEFGDKYLRSTGIAITICDDTGDFRLTGSPVGVPYR